MKIFYLVILVVAVLQLKTVCSSHSQLSRIDNLPSILVPRKYDLLIYTDFENEKLLFHGEVRITIHCNEKTKFITLNVKELTILKDKVSVKLQSDEPTEPINVKDHKSDDSQERHTIILENELKSDQDYIVFIPFQKKKSTDSSDLGYVQYNYSSESDDLKKIIAVTIADVNDARRIFPSFDQKNMKANFNLTLGLPSKMSNLKAISSLQFIEKKTDPNNNDWILATFQESPSMSTYSLAFVVANLKPMEWNNSDTKVLITIWADEAIITKIESTLKIFVGVIDFYSQYFGSNPLFEALDLIVLPGLREMKTEKSGLILLEESALLFSDSSSDDIIADVTHRLCYEGSRQWVGARASVPQWNEYWLDIGMASTLRDICFKKRYSSEQKYYLSDLNLVETFMRVLRTDGESVSSCVYVDEKDFNLTKMFSDSIVYDKAYLIIRMTNHFLGKNNFDEGMKEYFKSGNSNLDQVWEVFNKIAKDSNLLPEYTSVKTIVESWTKKKGYALVTVERHFANKKATLKQSRFVQLEDQESSSKYFVKTDEYWILPLNYATKTQLMDNEGNNFQAPIVWLKYSASISPIEKNDLVLVNLGMNVLCRVAYDERSQKMISDTLLNKEEYTIFDEMTRAHLIADMLALSEVGELDYDISLSTLKYLKHETSNFPLMVALYEFNKIRSTLFGLKTDLLKNYKSYVRDILTPIFAREEFVKISELPDIRRQFSLKKLIIESACSFDVEECIVQCKALFKTWRNSDPSNRDKIIPDAIKEIVFCQAIKNGELEDFKFLWQQFDKNNDRRFNEIILTALGCFHDEKLLEMYLIYSIIIDKEMPKYSHAIINGLVLNEMGYNEVKKFFISRKSDIKTHFQVNSGNIGSILVKLFEVTNTSDDFKTWAELKESMKDHLTDSENSIQQSMRTAKRNYLWREKHEIKLMMLLRNSMIIDANSIFEIGFN